VCATINGGFADQSELIAFWVEVLGDDADRMNDENYTSGFVFGALEAWGGANQRALR
jgi:hypothetical protein